MRNLLILCFFMLSALASTAQKTITGKVYDAANSLPLQGATITAKGDSKVTLAGADGSFSITVPDAVKVLIISFVGYQKQEIQLSGGTEDIEVRLEKTGDLNEVVVVGSRNLSRTKVQSPAPVDIIPVSQITNQVGQVDLNQILTYVAPSFQSSRQTIADGTDHIDPAQLRGLGSDQVLVLINGKRRHQSALVNVNGTVNRGQVGTDLGSIPATAIERVEVLRDGAAAQYGSDAIAGVINIVLKKNTNGLSGIVSYGANVTAYEKNYALNKLTNKDPNEKISVTDGANLQAALNFGFAINKKGFVNLNGEYVSRDFSNRTGTYTGQIYPAVGGVVKDDSIMSARSTKRNNFDMRIGNSKITGGSFMLNSQYSINSIWKFLLFGGYSKKNGEAAGFYRYPNSIFSNAGAFRNNALTVYPEGFLPLIQTNIRDVSVSAGLTGKFGLWNTSISNTFGVNNFDYTVNNSINYTQFAVTPNPQTKFDAGGIGFLQNTVNLDVSKKFGVLKGLNVAYGAEFRIDQYKQRAGEEASYRNFDTASKAVSGSQVFAGFTPQYAGKFNRNSAALYLDLEQDFTENFLLTGALRFENYSDFGSTLNYKLATRYILVKGLTIRASSSSGFRAPSMQQRFYAKTNTLFVSTPGGLIPVESGTFPNGSKPAQVVGIPKLKQETSMNYSAGITASPVRGLEITLDGYIINIKNRIVLTNNFTGGTNPVLDSILKANGAGHANFFTNAVDTKSKGLEAVVNYIFSVGREHSFRKTAAATFIKNEVRKGSDGKPIIKASDILVNSGQLGNYFNREDQSRVEVANPVAKGSFMTNYRFKQFSCMLRFAYFGKVTYLDPSLTNPTNPATWPVNVFTGQKETLDQTFSPKTITDLTLGYEIVKQLTFTIGATNLFDVYQDMHKHSNNMSLGRFVYSRRVQQMGFNGRYLFARINFDLGK